MVKNLPTMQETRVRSLGREYLLDKGRLPTPVLFSGESHGWRSLAGIPRLLGFNPWWSNPLDSRGLKESDITE